MRHLAKKGFGSCQVWLSRWSFRLCWEAGWPWLFYECLSAFVFVLYGWFLGELGSMLLAMLAASLFLVPVYRVRRKYAKGQKTERLLWKERGASAAGMKKQGGKRQAGTVFFFYVRLAWTAMCACLCLNLLLSFFGIAQVRAFYEPVKARLYSDSLWLSGVVMGVAAPFTEELIYRGLAYERLRELFSVSSAAVCSALFFGVTHGNFAQGVYAAALGMFLALIYEANGLAASVWFHVCANGTALGMNGLLQHSAACQEAFGAEMLWLRVLLAVVSGAGLLIGRDVWSRKALN